MLQVAIHQDGALARGKVLRFDDAVFDAEMSVSKLELGETIYYQAIIRDITERIQAENELEQRNIDLSAAYEELIASGEELKFRLEELRQSQEMLQESKKKYKDVADLLPEGIFECSLNEIYLCQPSGVYSFWI